MIVEKIAIDLEETRAIARQLATSLRSGFVIYLQGDLGAGKTTFAAALCEALGADVNDVASPTFALVHQYPVGDEMISHLDGYRLSDNIREWQELGVNELSRESMLTLVEWPRKALLELIPPDVLVKIEIEVDGSRRIRIESMGDDD